MKNGKFRILIICFILIGILFFSNDFGLINIEKEAIITACAIDITDDGLYEVTVQIAVPEATNTSTENTKAQLSGKGTTVGSAIKNTGDISGWFPQLAFCNLIILGSKVSQTNVISAVDYFSKTLRTQDSAQIILAENTAKELLNKTTPLDNISSFAIQKLLFKNPGFDTDVATNDIKNFCEGHYSSNSSTFMPIVKVLNAQSGSQSQEQTEQGNSGSSGDGNSTKGKNYFDASSTALFVNGIKVGELNKQLTHTFNMLSRNVKGTTIPVNDVAKQNDNYLLSVLKCTPKIKIKTDSTNVYLNIKVDIYCKIADHNSDDPNASLENNKPLPSTLTKKAEELLTQRVYDLIEVSKQTNCDFLSIQNRLYRYCHKYYKLYKDNYLQNLVATVTFNISGQK